MSTPQYISPSLVRLLIILREFEDTKLLQKNLIEYYCNLITKRIKTLSITSKLVQQVYDLLYVFEKYGKGGNEITQLVVHYKILEVRALVLDLICDDYCSEAAGEEVVDGKHVGFISSRILRVPDSWIIDIVSDLRDTYDLDNPHAASQQLLNLFILAFFSDCKDVFVGKKMFKSMGNQLVFNLAYFCERMDRYVNMDWNVLDVFYEHIEDGLRIDKEKIIRFLREECSHIP